MTETDRGVLERVAAIIAEASPPEPAHDWLTTEEIAVRYRVTPSTVRYWKHAKIGIGTKGVRHGRRTLYPRAAVEEYDRQLAARAATA
jgi:Helix-turn-helix domain